MPSETEANRVTQRGAKMWAVRVGGRSAGIHAGSYRKDEQGDRKSAEIACGEDEEAGNAI